MENRPIELRSTAWLNKPLNIISSFSSLNSFRPSETIWRIRSESTLVNVTACSKPLPAPMWTNHQWNPMPFTWGQYPWYEFESYLNLKLQLHLPETEEWSLSRSVFVISEHPTGFFSCNDILVYGIDSRLNIEEYTFFTMCSFLFNYVAYLLPFMVLLWRDKIMLLIVRI